MGACFSSIYDVAIGDVAPAEAGSASGALSAVHQLAAAIDSAVVTTVYFSQRAGHGAGHAMLVSVAAVGGIAALGLGLVWLLPKAARGSRSSADPPRRRAPVTRRGTGSGAVSEPAPGSAPKSN